MSRALFPVSVAGHRARNAAQARRVTRFFRSEAGAVLLWVVASVLLAAAVVPWLYLGGKHFAAVVADDAGGLIGWLASASGRAGFGRYYNRCLLLCALVLVPVMMRRMRTLRLERLAAGMALPVRPVQVWWRNAVLWLGGAVIAGGLVWCLGLVLAEVGAFAGSGVKLTFGKALTKAVFPAMGASVVEETVFRGLLLGLWLRVARPWAACLGSSLVFAVMHFLSPAPGYVIADPTSPFAGFELLGAMLLHYTDPRFFVADFLTLAGVGLVLAGARVRTGSLGLSMGLHCGWVAAFKLYHLTHYRLVDGPVDPLLVGDSLRSGILPLAMLGITAGLCNLLLRWWHFPETRN